MTQEVQRIDITSSTIWRVLLLVAFFWFLYLIRDFLLLLFGALVFSAAIEPAVNQFERMRIPRALSALLVFVVIGGLFSLAVTLVIPPLVEQIRQLAQGSPEILDQFEEKLQVISPEAKVRLGAALQDGFHQLGNQLGSVGVNVLQQTRSLLSSVLTLFFFLVITFYLAVERDALKKLARLMFRTASLAYVESRIDLIKRRIGLWLLGQLSLAVIMGVISGVGLWLLGVRYALVLGILAGIMELIPVMGPILSGTLAVILALTQSLGLGVVVLVFYLIIQQVESGFLIPNVMKRTTGLHPLVVIISILLGARLVGVVGVILAVPTATILVMLWKDIFMPGHEESLTEAGS